MATANHPLEPDVGLSSPARLARWLPALSALALLALALAAVTYRYPPPAFGWVALGGLGLVGLLALVLTRYDAAVAVGFLLLGVVAVEPAPPDLVFAVVIAVAAVTGRFDLERVPFAILAALGAFLTVNILSMMEVVDPAAGARYLAITLYLAVFSVWLAGYVNSHRRARVVVLTYLAAAVFSALIGSLAYFYAFPGSESLLFGGDEESGAFRVRGLFEDANVFAPFLIPIALILLEEILHPRLVRLSRAIKIVLLLILVLGVMLAFSRAAYLNLAVGILVLLIVLAMRRGGGAKAGALLAIIVTMGVIVAGTLVATGSDEFLTERANLQSYDTGRFAAQRAGVELGTQRPLGIGPGQFEIIEPIAAHSTYVRSFAEQGALGFLSFAAIALITLGLSARNAARGRHTYGIGSAALLAAWCGILANSLVIDSIHWRHLFVVAGLIWAGATASAAIGEARSRGS